MDDLSVFWFRRDLRINDNKGFERALNSGNPVIPIFIFDKNILNDLEDKADARVTFIHQQVKKLHSVFRDHNSGLKVFHDKPVNVFKELISKFKIRQVFTNEDYEPYARDRDQKVREFLESNGIAFETVRDHIIFDPNEIFTEQGSPYKVFTPYKNRWLDKIKPADYRSANSERHLNKLFKTSSETPIKLEELGFKESALEIPEARFDEKIISKYDEKRNFPGIQSTTRLGVHLRHGTISIREAVKKGVELSDTWLNELIWREFYTVILFHWPKVADHSFKSEYDRIEWLNDESVFMAWCDGKTGFPIVDAGMRELNKTGFMHNRVRMITSSFLTKMLLVDWRWGERYFAQKLLDYELSSNNGGWQWAAGTGTDAQPYFRIFNPYSQTDKFDKDRKYINKWIPELDTKDYPEPIVDYKFVRQRALDTYKKALGKAYL